MNDTQLKKLLCKTVKQKTMHYNNLTDLARQIHADNVAKGFYDEEVSISDNRESIFNNDEQYFFVRNAMINQKLMLICTEVAEACEAVRKNRFFSVGADRTIAHYLQDAETATPQQYKNSYEALVKDKFEAELAGTLIRVLDLCGRMGIDIESHVQAELKYNRTRQYKHGKNC